MYQPFTANLAELRKSMHKSEARWLKCTAGDDRVVYRNEYLKARQSYSKAVKKAKREFQYHKRIQLEAELECPRKVWGSKERTFVSQRRRITRWRCLEVFDEEGNIKKDYKAVEVWFNHLLGGGSMRDAHSAPESSCQGDGGLDLSDRLCAPISVEEITWALHKIKKDAAVGQDDIGAEMMMAIVCWKFG